MQREYEKKFKDHLGVTTDGKPLKSKVQHDKGYDSNLFPYDNGLVGWQCMNGFKSIEEAKKDLADRKKLTPKYGVEAYADVFMVTR